MTLLMGVASGVGVDGLSVVWVGALVDILDVIVRPLERRELSVDVREASRASRWDCSAILMASSSCDVYSRE